MRHCFPLADLWFHVTESTCFKCKVVHFKAEKVQKCIRMGITVPKIVIWESKLLVLKSQITIYDYASQIAFYHVSAEVSLYNEISNHKTDNLPP